MEKKLPSTIAVSQVNKGPNVELPMSEFNVAQGIFRKGGRYSKLVLMFDLEYQTYVFVLSY